MEGEGGLGEAGRLLPKTPSFFFPSPAFRPMIDPAAGKTKAAKPFFVHPGSKPRLQRTGRPDKKERSPAVLIAGFTASSQQIVCTS